MKAKGVIKTGVSLYIDLIFFAFIAFIVAATIGSVLRFLFNFDVAIFRATVSIVGIIVFIILMYWNFKYRYKKSSIEEKESVKQDENEQIKKDD